MEWLLKGEGPNRQEVMEGWEGLGEGRGLDQPNLFSPPSQVDFILPAWVSQCKEDFMQSHEYAQLEKLVEATTATLNTKRSTEKDGSTIVSTEKEFFDWMYKIQANIEGDAVFQRVEQRLRTVLQQDLRKYVDKACLRSYARDESLQPVAPKENDHDIVSKACLLSFTFYMVFNRRAIWY